VKTNNQLTLLHLEIEKHLNEISLLFKPNIRITFIARLPGNDEADVVLSIDDLSEAIKVLERSQHRGKTK